MNQEIKNRKRLLELLNHIPKGIPAGWEMDSRSVGGLMYLGISAVQTEKLIVISSQGQRIIDCRTGEKIYCEENYDECELTACAKTTHPLMKCAGRNKNEQMFF